MRFGDHSHPNGFIRFNISPAISMSSTIGAFHTCDDAIMSAFESQRSVIVVRIMWWSWTVPVSIGKRTVLAFKVMNTIFLAVSVLALPYHYGITFGAVETKKQFISLCPLKSHNILTEFCFDLLSLITNTQTSKKKNGVLSTRREPLLTYIVDASSLDVQHRWRNCLYLRTLLWSQWKIVFIRTFVHVYKTKFHSVCVAPCSVWDIQRNSVFLPKPCKSFLLGILTFFSNFP